MPERTSQAATSFRVAVRSDDLLRVAWLLMADGKQGQALVVADVPPGSLAEQAGIRPGQRLLEISDTMRPDQMWPLKDRPSPRFIRDALRMRRRTDTTLTLQQWVSEAELPTPASESDSEGAVVMPLSRPAASMASVDPSSDDDTAPASSGSSGSQLLGSLTQNAGGGSSNSGGGTIGDRLAERWRVSEAAGAELTAVQKRMEKRKEYMAEVGKRDDSGLAIVLLASFLLPSAVILGIAASTGYLERLYSNSLTLH